MIVDPPREWLDLRRQAQDPRVVWRMLRKLNGRRDGSAAWVAYISEVIVMGFDRHIGCPHLFRHADWGVTLELHQDDVHGCGSDAGSLAFLDQVRKDVACKVRSGLAPGHDHEHLKDGAS